MTRQEQFKAELFDLLRRYTVEMSVEEDGFVTGINFYSYTHQNSECCENDDIIDFSVGRRENGKE